MVYDEKKLKKKRKIYQLVYLCPVDKTIESIVFTLQNDAIKYAEDVGLSQFNIVDIWAVEYKP